MDDWYTLTETSSAILNELGCYTIREEIKERKKKNSDYQRINDLQKFCREVQLIEREPENFKSIARMQEIIDMYAPKARAMNEGSTSVHLPQFL